MEEKRFVTETWRGVQAHYHCARRRWTSGLEATHDDRTNEFKKSSIKTEQVDQRLASGDLKWRF